MLLNAAGARALVVPSTHDQARISAADVPRTTKPRRTTLLLDFDCVVLKPCSAHGLVTRRARAFTRTRITKADRKADVSDAFCDALYGAHGHTVLGLRALGHDDVTRAEFDAYVYRYVDRTYFNDVRSDAAHRLHTHTLHRLVDGCQKAGVDLRLFSNAPDAWCDTALRAMDPVGDLSTALLATSTTAVTGDHLKPQAESYALVEAAVLAGSRDSQGDADDGDGDDHVIWFADDQLKNLSPIMHNPRWRKVLVAGGTSASVDGAGPQADGQRTSTRVQDGLYVVPDLQALLHL